MDLGIRGRVALVCGSTRGLGYAIAYRLAAEGCRVGLNGRDAARVADAAKALANATGAEVAGFAADVARAGDATGLVERAIRQFGAVDILLCNAGGPPATSFADAPPESWQSALDLNLLSAIHVCRAALPGMRQRRWGRIVCLASIAALQVTPGLILSTTARAGLLGFAKTLADEVAGAGVTVNVVCPGFMRTERAEELLASRASRSGRTTEEVTAELVRGIPAGRVGEPDELAAAVAFLASEPARYITGAVLPIDGGSRRSIT